MKKINKIFILLLFSIILLALISNVSAGELSAYDNLTDVNSVDGLPDINVVDGESSLESINEESSLNNVDVEDEKGSYPFGECSEGYVSSVDEDCIDSISSIDEDADSISYSDDKQSIFNNNALSHSNDEKLSYDILSYNSLNNLINGNDDSDIYLEKDFTFVESLDSDYKFGIVIDRPLTIHGNGHYINGSLNKQSQGRIFKVNSDNVTFINISFNNVGFASADDYECSGGAIYSSSNIYNTTVINSSFTNCYGYWGGALYDVDAINCSFNYCYVGVNLGGAMYGGSATNCTFIENRAGYGGGAIYQSYAVDCVFIGNSARYGGAMRWSDGINCTFINNTAVFNGGAVYTDSLLINCTFINNSAYVGGAVSEGFQQVDMINCTFINNSAISAGGAVDGGDLAFCRFINNTAPEYPDYVNSTVHKITVAVEDITVDYPSQVVFPISLSCNGTVYDGMNVSIELYKNFILVGNYSCLSGSTWADYLDAGTYSLIVKLDPEYLLNDTFTSHIKVNGIPTKIVSSDMRVCVGEDRYLIATLINNLTNESLPYFNVTVGPLNNRSSWINLTTDENGQFNISLKDLEFSYNSYLYYLGFLGYENYESYQTSVKITVDKLRTWFNASDMTVYYNNECINYAGKLFDEHSNPMSNVNISVFVYYENSCIYEIPNEESGLYLFTNQQGEFNFTLPKLAGGNYVISLYYWGNETVYGTNLRKSLIIKKYTPVIDVADLIILYNTEGDLIATFTNNDTSELLTGFNFTVSFNGESINRTVDDNGQIKIHIPILEKGIYPVSIEFESTDYYYGANKTVNVNVTETFTSINLTEGLDDVSDINILYNETPLAINFTLFDEFGNSLTGFNLSVSFNGDSFIRTTDELGQISIEVPVLEANAYPITIGFAGKGLYRESSKTFSLNINKVKTIIEAYEMDISHESNHTFVARFSDEFGNALTGFNLSVSFNGDSFNRTTDGLGQISIEIPDLDSNVYPLTISYSGDNLYNQSTKTVNISLNQIKTVINASNISIFYNQTPEFVATLYDEFGDGLNGTQLYITINNEGFDKTTDEFGQIRFNIPLLLAGDYPLSIGFAGNNTHKYSYKTVNVQVKQKNTTLDANNTFAFTGEGKVIARLVDEFNEPAASQTVYLSINNQERPFNTDSNGQVIFDISDLDEGTYNASVIFRGNELYIASSINVSVYIGKLSTTLASNNIEYKYGETGEIIVRLTDINGDVISGAVINFKNDLTDENISTNETGEAKLILDKSLVPDVYSLNINYGGSNKYFASSAEVRFHIEKLDTNVTTGGLSLCDNDNCILVLNLMDENKNPIKNGLITINNSGQNFTNYTNESGQAIFAMNLPTGISTLKIIYLGNVFYHSSFLILNVTINEPVINTSTGNSSGDNGASYGGGSSGGSGGSGGSSSGGNSGGSGGSSSNVAISKISTYLYVPKVNTVYKSGKYLVATLKDNKGRVISNAKVIIRIGGKNHYKTTNSKGQVKLLINLVPKIYSGTVYFAGTNKYKKSSATARVFVNKIKPKIVASKKTFSRKVKTKKYTVTLKDNKNKVMKNVKLTLKVKGITYSAKTNSKGQATFNIKNLNKKGSSKAFIQFKANKYYSYISKTVSFTVK